MRLLIGVAATAALLNSFPLPAKAAGHETCIVYSNDAIRKAQEAASLRCGFSGPAWSTDPSGHMRWCVGANEDSVEYERKARDNLLFNCRYCRDYANSASQDNNENVQLHCGFTGARWQSNSESHFLWCVNNPAHDLSEADAEKKARAGQLSECRCNRYADEAIDSANQNTLSNCGFTGARWISDRHAHYQWCLKFGSDAAKAESDARQAMLHQCQQKVGPAKAVGKHKMGPVVTAPTPNPPASQCNLCSNNGDCSPAGTEAECEVHKTAAEHLTVTPLLKWSCICK